MCISWTIKGLIPCLYYLECFFFHQMPTNEHEIKMLSAIISCFLNHLSVFQQTVIGHSELRNNSLYAAHTNISSSARKLIPCIFATHNSRPFVSVLPHINPVHELASYLFKVQYNITLLALLDPGSTLPRNVGNYQSIRRHTT